MQTKKLTEMNSQMRDEQTRTQGETEEKID
jgi:hypothetical protein